MFLICGLLSLEIIRLLEREVVFLKYLTYLFLISIIYLFSLKDKLFSSDGFFLHSYFSYFLLFGYWKEKNIVHFNTYLINQLFCFTKFYTDKQILCTDIRRYYYKRLTIETSRQIFFNLKSVLPEKLTFRNDLLIFSIQNI